MSNIEGFPDHRYATKDGLLALGGDLSPERLLLAYRNGIFPWYNPGEPILWWSPDPRCVLLPNEFHASRSLRKAIQKNGFNFTFDKDFTAVIENCALPRKSGSGTWISGDMKRAYIELHSLGHAHSVETWRQGKLVGGLYGIAIGKVFFGESMFSSETDASKASLQFLINQLLEWEFQLIDCQITSPHLISLGAEEIPRDRFIKKLKTATAIHSTPRAWSTAETLK